MDLKLIHTSSEDNVYKNRLTNNINGIGSALLKQDIWTPDFIASIEKFKNEHLGARSLINFTSLPDIVALELKFYWAKLLCDERNNSQSIIERRLLPLNWIRTNWSRLSEHFEVDCIADIPCPEFPKSGFTTSNRLATKLHNQDLINLFSQSEINSGRSLQTTSFVQGNDIIHKKYLSPRITLIGDYHKNIFINREQFKPFEKRNIIFLNDLYDEEDIRFKDTQRTADTYLNFYLFPVWMRKSIKTHILEKIRFNELGPKTLRNYFGRMNNFRDFMYEKFENPSPALITRNLIEDQFLSWGNDNKKSGKNWFTDTVAMLETAARFFPNEWPALTVSLRVTKKIKKVHYKEGLGKLKYAMEGAGRAYSQNVIEQLKIAAKDAPRPAMQVFSLILATGARSEDGHALLFNCLIEDPHDDRFMLLHFWQNKVRKWNIKPLLKNDENHAFVINLIQDQQKHIIEQYGKATQYLFPSFTGTKESFVSPHWTLNEIKKQCVKHHVQDNKGNILSFSWHPLRHTKGTSMAAEGHDILSIMMELGHTSPEMATVYVNNILELKKHALVEKGSGKFFTIQGDVDEKIGTLLFKKAELTATRVCGGRCLMPAQIAEWCEHANACYTCTYYRADENDLEYFKSEKGLIEKLIQTQQDEAEELKDTGRKRMSQITLKRLQKNKDVYNSLTNIIKAIESSGRFKGTLQNIKQTNLEFGYEQG